MLRPRFHEKIFLAVVIFGSIHPTQESVKDKTSCFCNILFDCDKAAKYVSRQLLHVFKERNIKINDPSYNYTKIASVKDTFQEIFLRFSKQILHAYTMLILPKTHILCIAAVFLETLYEKWWLGTFTDKSLTYWASPPKYIKMCLPL